MSYGILISIVLNQSMYISKNFNLKYLQLVKPNGKNKINRNNNYGIKIFLNEYVSWPYMLS